MVLANPTCKPCYSRATAVLQPCCSRAAALLAVLQPC